ncbi:MAG: hypothetical protein LBJ18_04050 [Rickettsiales bacterium]|jgi:hypothetical protein|nr:hypothetical protein [Rickettsiales bacterium]
MAQKTGISENKKVQNKFRLKANPKIWLLAAASTLLSAKGLSQSSDNQSPQSFAKYTYVDKFSFADAQPRKLNADSIFSLAPAEIGKYILSRRAGPTLFEIDTIQPEKIQFTKSGDDIQIRLGEFDNMLNVVRLTYFPLDTAGFQNLPESVQKKYFILDAFNKNIPGRAAHELDHVRNRIHNNIGGLTPAQMIPYEVWYEAGGIQANMLHAREKFIETGRIEDAFPEACAFGLLRYMESNPKDKTINWASFVRQRNWDDFFKSKAAMTKLKDFQPYISWLLENKDNLQPGLVSADEAVIITKSVMNKMRAEFSYYGKIQINEELLEEDLRDAWAAQMQYLNNGTPNISPYSSLVREMQTFDGLCMQDITPAKSWAELAAFIDDYAGQTGMLEKVDAIVAKFPQYAKARMKIFNMIGLIAAKTGGRNE